ALRDCLRSIRAPAIEVHITNIEKRGFGSVTSEAAVGMIAGFGIQSYVMALDAMVARLRK
ncbi:MAG: type II 3-dehydroquinate dehydratase, partial [Proteobacteria bacterium]|nr:type II 3-dehydroquinate dehydratase [Pseudomonadota bacterium]